jgi:hypothetical protein
LEGRKNLSDRETAIDRLYSAPFEQFVAVRAEVAGRLREKGDEDGAAEVAKLKKPTLSAWVINQLVRTKALDVARLLKAGETLDKAQQRLLTGKSSEFDAARREEAAAVRLLQSAAREILPTASAAVLDRVTQTLRSATSAENRAVLKAGRLTTDLEPPGFGAFSFTASPETGKTRGKSAKVSPSRVDELNTRRKAAVEDATRQTAEALELERAAREAELVARKARQRAETARARAEKASEEVGRVTAELEALKKKR